VAGVVVEEEDEEEGGVLSVVRGSGAVSEDVLVIVPSWVSLLISVSGSTGGKISHIFLPHFSQKKSGVFLARTFRSLAGKSSAPMAPSPFVGINEMSATRTVRMLHEGCQCSGW